MGIKPIDVQVNISQINHVARMHQNEQGHHRDVQLYQGQHMVKDAEAMAHTIQQTHQPENEESLVKERKEGRQAEEHAGKQKEHKDHDPEQENEEGVFKKFDEKGSLFDGFS
jgi:hypothetical protein